MSVTRYEILTIADMAAIPRERWDAFVVDLTIAVNAIRATQETFSLGPEDMHDGVLLWTDDAEPGCELTLRDPAGAPVVTVKASEGA